MSVRSGYSIEFISSTDASRAERHRLKYIETWAMERWLDMGMATVIFTVHVNRKGQLVADV